MPERFHAMTRRNVLDRVLSRASTPRARLRAGTGQGQRGAAARGQRGRGRNTWSSTRADHGWELRFIEFMPLERAAAGTPVAVVSGEEVRRTDRRGAGPSSPTRIGSTRTRRRRATSFKSTVAGRIGFIDSVTRTVLRRLQPSAADLGRQVPRLSLRSGARGRPAKTPTARGRDRRAAGRAMMRHRAVRWAKGAVGRWRSWSVAQAAPARAHDAPDRRVGSGTHSGLRAMMLAIARSRAAVPRRIVQLARRLQDFPVGEGALQLSVLEQVVGVPGPAQPGLVDGVGLVDHHAAGDQPRRGCP